MEEAILSLFHENDPFRPETTYLPTYAFTG